MPEPRVRTSLAADYVVYPWTPAPLETVQAASDKLETLMIVELVRQTLRDVRRIEQRES